MRIGIDGREFVKGKKTGTGRYLHHFLLYAPKQKPDWKFYVFIHHRCEYRNSNRNVFVQKVPQLTTFLWDQCVLPGLLKHFKIDQFLNSYLKYPLLSSCPMVLVINDLAAFQNTFATGAKRFFQNLYFRSLVKGAVQRARRILTISEYSKKEISSRLRVPLERIDVVPLAVEDSYHPLDQEDHEVLKKYGIRSPYLLYMGDTRPHKNVSFLLESYATLPSSLRERYPLILAGSWGSGVETLKHRCIQQGIDQQVHFCGFVEEEDLPKIYAQATLFLYPSLYEGFGLPPLEAMACGVPVICSNRTSLPEVVGDGGLLLDPIDPERWSEVIQHLLKDDNARKELAEKGRERARLFTPEKSAERFLHFLEETGQT